MNLEEDDFVKGIRVKIEKLLVISSSFSLEKMDSVILYQLVQYI